MNAEKHGFGPQFDPEKTGDGFLDMLGKFDDVGGGAVTPVHDRQGMIGGQSNWTGPIPLVKAGALDQPGGRHFIASGSVGHARMPHGELGTIESVLSQSHLERLKRVGAKNRVEEE